MVVQSKHKPCYALGLYVRQELCIVAIRNDINFVSRSGCCDTPQKYIRDIGSREREQAVRNVNYQNVLINLIHIRSLVIAIASNKRNLSENGP